MTIRFDDDARAVRLSVRDLAEAAGPRGHLTLDVVQRRTRRMEQGREVHRAWQADQQALDASYRAEVRLTHQLELNGWTVTLHGRVDGLTDIAGHVVVEEVKSTALPSGRLYTTGRDDWHSHIAQLEVYLWMLDAAQHASPVGRLVLVSVADGAQHIIGVPLDAVVREYSLQRQLATTIHRACGLCSKEAAGKHDSNVKEAASRRWHLPPLASLCGSGLLPKQPAFAPTCTYPCWRRPRPPDTNPGT